MKFALWFVCIVFPLMYIFMGDFALGAVCTMFLFGVVTGIRWLFVKAQEGQNEKEHRISGDETHLIGEPRILRAIQLRYARFDRLPDF